MTIEELTIDKLERVNNVFFPNKLENEKDYICMIMDATWKIRVGKCMVKLFGMSKVVARTLVKEEASRRGG